MRTVYFDIDTQIDFVYPAGALYVPGAEKLIPAWSRLNGHAKEQGIPLVSSLCAHAENDAEFREWPAHCVVGTKGRQKPRELMMDQIILEKQQLDLFTCPQIDSVLEQLAPEHCVVYGVVTEYCVRFAALGLQARGSRVTLVADAIQALDTAVAERFFHDFEADGGKFSTTSNILLSK